MSRQREEADLRAALERNREGMADSTVFLQLWDARIMEDALACLQLGLAIMMDKPVFLVVPPGCRLPENMRRLARGVLEATLADPGDREKIAAWIAAQAQGAPEETP